MKTYYLNIICLVCLQFMIVACKSDPDPVPNRPTPPPSVSEGIKLSVSALTFTSDAGTLDIEVTASGKWSASSSYPWCKVSTNGSKASVSVEKNELLEDRNVRVTFTCGSKSALLTVTQKGKSTLLLSTSKVSVSAKEQNIAVKVKSNIDYACEIDRDAAGWISKVESRSVTEKSFSFHIAANNGSLKREGKVYFSGAGLKEVLYVYQDGGEEPELLLTQNEFVVNAKPTVVKIELRSNTRYRMELPGVDWMREDKSRAMSTYTHYIAIDENKGDKDRSAKINFLYGDKVEEVVVIQKAKAPIDFNKEGYRFDSDGGILEISILEGTKYNVSTPYWIEKKADSSAKDVVTFCIEESTLLSPREGDIVFTINGVEYKIPIVQEGRSTIGVYLVGNLSQFVIPEFTYSKEIVGTIDWGDGTKEAFKKNAKHTYANKEFHGVQIELHGATSIHIDKMTDILAVNLNFF